MTTARTLTENRGVFFDGDLRLLDTREAIREFGAIVQLAIADDLFTEADLKLAFVVENEARFVLGLLKEAQEQVASLPLVDYDLKDSVTTLWKGGIRPAKALYAVRICTIRDLLHKTAKELRSLPQFGEVSLAVIRRGLAERGLRLQGD